MADNGDGPQEALQRTPSNMSTPRAAGSKLPRRGQGKKRVRKADSDTGLSRQSSQLTSVDDRADSPVERLDSKPFESQLPRVCSPSPDTSSQDKPAAVPKSGGKQKAASRSVDRQVLGAPVSTPKAETPSRLTQSPEVRTSASFEGLAKGDKRSKIPQAPSSPRTPDISTHRRTPSSVPSVTSGISSLGDERASSPDTQVEALSPKQFEASTTSVHKKTSKEGLTAMGKPAEEKAKQIPPVKEESFVHVQDQDKDSGRDNSSNGHKKINGHHDPSSNHNPEQTLAGTESGSAETHQGVSYADALKEDVASHSGQRDDENRSDDSYPELDPMEVEFHNHQPSPVHEPNARIRWAPWDVPAKRRLQTLMVLVHCLGIAGLVSLFFAMCAIPFAWPLLLLYLLHVLSSKASTDGLLKYRFEWLRKSPIWHLFAGYFPAKLHKTHDLPSTRKYIFGYHPHGIISHGAWAAFATEALGFAEKFPGITNSLLTLDSNFRIPFYRDYILGMGVRSVSKESIVNILSKGGPNNEGMGRAVTIVIGGARESLEAQPGQMRLILKERKGFIKIAVRAGADLVPVLAFGENDLYDQLRPREHPVVHKIQLFVLKVWKFTLPFLHGRGIFNYDVGLMPYRQPLNVVVGAPIKVTQSNDVDNAEIDRLHGLYVAEVEKLWDRYKDEFAPDRKEELQILT